MGDSDLAVLAERGAEVVAAAQALLDAVHQTFDREYDRVDLWPARMRNAMERLEKALREQGR